MRLTEAISFFQKNPTKDEVHLYTHIDVGSEKEKMKIDEDYRKAVKRHRKDFKMNKIVCLCGSTKFKKEFETATWEESLEGKIVLSVCCFTHHDGLIWTDDEIAVFHDLHRKKIEMADEILVINPEGYIGETTKEEIDYAKSLNKVVRYKYDPESFIVRNNFVAIDFETATAQSNAPCSVGLIKVVDNVIVDAYYSLIDPRIEKSEWQWASMKYNGGITYEIVQGAPTFTEVWEEILPMLMSADFVVAHQMHIEQKIIKICCELNDIEEPDITFKDSRKCVQKNYDLKKTGLDDVCKAFEIELEHHHALWDACGSARILIKYFADSQKRKITGEVIKDYKYDLSEEESAIIDKIIEAADANPISRSCDDSCDKSNLGTSSSKHTYPPRPATESQKNYLLNLGASEEEISEMDVKTASIAISDLIEQNKKRNDILRKEAEEAAEKRKKFMSSMQKCKTCGEDYPPKSLSQKYCKPSCRPSYKGEKGKNDKESDVIKKTKKDEDVKPIKRDWTKFYSPVNSNEVNIL